MALTDTQWSLIQPLFPKPRAKRGSRGRPPCDFRDVLDGILWVLRTGAPWHDMPSRYPSYQTCHRRFQQWCNDGTFERILVALRRDLEERGGMKDIESFIDGTYVGAQKGGFTSGVAVPEMRRKSWRLQTAMVFHWLSSSRAVPGTT